ncbi:complexed with cef1p [Peltigera leucophlebia]|nr:complexed with cef1p [Peltigera leucophlebia]
MTTAHRPTFDPARGKDAQRGVAYHQRLLPAHTQLKTRQPGQGGDADPQIKDLRAQLLEAEAAHFAKKKGSFNGTEELEGKTVVPAKRQLEASHGQDGEVGEDIEAKRRRVLEETRDIDADSDGSSSTSSEEDSEEEEEDETAELLRELEKIKRERAEQRAQQEREKAEEEQAKREHDIALGNPLLNATKSAESKRRWDDDVVFRNQARGTENKGKKEFVNDLLRSDFHKRFMVRTNSPPRKYVRLADWPKYRASTFGDSGLATNWDHLYA